MRIADEADADYSWKRASQKAKEDRHDDFERDQHEDEVAHVVETKAQKKPSFANDDTRSRSRSKSVKRKQSESPKYASPR